MLPYVYIGRFPLPLYGVIIVLGFAIGCLLSVRRAPKFHFQKDDCFYALLFGIIGVVVGGKILYILVDLPSIIQYREFLFGTEEGFKALMGGGFVFYGGLFGGILGAYIYCRMYKLSFYDFLQTVIPVVPLIHGIGRIGCFCAGCCYGVPWDPPVGMLFSASPTAPHGVHLFPVQLLEAGLNCVLWVILIWIFRKPKKVPAAGAYLVGYGIVRLICERFRYDEARGFFLGLSTSQWISILVIPVGLGVIWYFYRKNNRTPAEEDEETAEALDAKGSASSDRTEEAPGEREMESKA